MAKKSKKKYKIYKWYSRLSDPKKRMVRSQYVRTFKVHERRFYDALRRDSLRAEELEFFSMVFRRRMDKLIAVPLQIESLKNVSLKAEAEALGLSK